MKFEIVIKLSYILYRMQVEQIEKGKTFEKVSGKDRSIVLQSNRPLLRSKGLKHRRIDWKVLEGEVTKKTALEMIIEAIEKHLEPERKG